MGILLYLASPTLTVVDEGAALGQRIEVFRPVVRLLCPLHVSTSSVRLCDRVTVKIMDPIWHFKSGRHPRNDSRVSALVNPSCKAFFGE